MIDDMTFCGNRCDNTKCCRHRSNIKEPQYPNSIAYLEGTKYCEKKPTPEPKSARLIDAEALKKAIEQGEGFSWDSHGKDDLCVRKKYIDNAPTVEYTFEEAFQKTVCENRLYCPARPQGKWKETGYETGALGITYRQTQCSNCGWEQALPMYLNFCPNCGADMRGDNNANTERT